MRAKPGRVADVLATQNTVFSAPLMGSRVYLHVVSTSSPHVLHLGSKAAVCARELLCLGGRARWCRPVPRPRLLAAGQIAVNGDRANRAPASRELDLCYRRRCGWPARLACAPAAGDAGCAGRRAGLTHPRRRTSTAPAVMSGGTAGPAACVTARSSRRMNSLGGSRASWPASATSTTPPSTPRLQPEEAPGPLPADSAGVDDPSRVSRGCRAK